MHPDGDRMVIAALERAPDQDGPDTPRAPVPLAVVNWFTELRAAMGN